ncbi:MAG TPA: hypothetical protein VNL71_08410 [Chloroflexota bacterium]|nr:hypothetical protein [Chloroflexota bacterium]
MWSGDLPESPFSREERKFLSRAGRANVPVDILVERVEKIVGPEPPARGRQAYLTRQLIAERLFQDEEEARAFADSYYALVKAGPISKHLLWDWE